MSRHTQAGPRRGARRTLRGRGLLLTFAALAATSPAYAFDAGDGRQQLIATGATAPGSVVEAPTPPLASPGLVYGDHALGISGIATPTTVDPATTLPVFQATQLTGSSALPASASQIAVQDGFLYAVDRSVGVVRVPWNDLTGTWDTASAENLFAAPLATELGALRPDAIASDGSGNLYVGFIRSEEIIKIASPSDTPVVVRDFAATTDGGGGSFGFAFDDATGLLYLVDGVGVGVVDLANPGPAALLEGVDVVAAGGIALDASGVTWNGRKNLLVGTATGVDQINLEWAPGGPVVDRQRVYAEGLPNVSGLHLLQAGIDAPAGLGDPVFSTGVIPPGTLLVGEDASAGAATDGKWVAVKTDPGYVAPPAGAGAPPGFPVARKLTAPSDLAWGEDGTLYVTDHFNGPSIVTPTPTPAIDPDTNNVRPLYNNTISGKKGLVNVDNPFTSPGAMVFDAFGNAWITDNAATGGGKIFKIPAKPDGSLDAAAVVEVTAFVDATGKGLRPDAAAVDRSGNLYIALRNGEIVRMSDLQRAHPVIDRGWLLTPSGRAAAGLEIDGTGALLVADGTDVYRVADLAAPVLEPFVTAASLPQGVAMAAPGDMVLTPDALHIMDDAEVIRVPFATPPLGVPDPTAPVPAGATVEMAGLVLGGGLVADEATRAPAPGMPTSPKLFAGTDFLNEGTGVVLASEGELPEPGLRSPAVGPVSALVLTNPGGLAFGDVTPHVMVARPDAVTDIDFVLRPAGGGADLPVGVLAGLTPADFASRTIDGPVIDTASAPDGDYELVATARNGAGAETQEYRLALTLDNHQAAPAFATGDFVTRTGATFTLKGVTGAPGPIPADQAYEGVTNVQFWVGTVGGGAPDITKAPTLTDSAAPFRAVRNFAADGTVQVAARINRAGRPSVDVPAHLFTVDGVAPTVAVGAVPAFLQGTVDFTADAADANLDVPSVAFQVQGATAQPVVTPGVPPAFGATFDSTTVADGVRTLTVSAADRAGNVTTAAPVQIVVDNLAPAVEATLDGDGRTVIVTATNAGTPIDLVTLSWDGGSVTLPAAVSRFALPPGTYTNLKATVHTAAHGDTASAPLAPVTVADPAVAPPAPVVAPALAGGAGGLLTLAGVRVVGPTGAPITAAGVYGPVAVTFSVNRPATVSFVVSTTTGKVVRSLKRSVKRGKVMLLWNGRDAKGARVKAGVYRIQVVAVDAAGHRKVVTRTVRVR